MNVWRLIANHDKVEEAVRLYRRDQFIALGWGGIGDLKTPRFTSAGDVAEAIRDLYPGLRNAGAGGRCLWALAHEVRIGDLMILSARRVRVGVFEVTGDYYWERDADPVLGNYQHRRKVSLSAHDPNKTWKEARRVQGDRWSPFWPLIRRGEL